MGVANIKDIAEAGADFFVAGSAILKNPRTQEARAYTFMCMYMCMYACLLRCVLCVCGGDVVICGVCTSV